MILYIFASSDNTIKMIMKILTTPIFLLISINCYSQITTIIAKTKEEPVKAQKYDSLENLNYDNAALHTGQTLFLKGNSYSKENGFYSDFFLKSDSWGDKYVYKPTRRDKDGRIVSSYSELVGKYYKVVCVEPIENSINDTIYWVKLVGEDNTPFYFKLEDGYGTPFITLGYYEKMKQTFVGKEFYFKGRYELNKVDTIETVIPPFKTKFKCTDIAVNVGEDGPAFAVLENEKYGKVKGEIIHGKKLDNFITISYYNECVKKYGTKFGSWVAEGKIEMGMNKKMVIDAWGAPDHINTTDGDYGKHEQWIYGKSYLYFTNGRLTSMQY